MPEQARITQDAHRFKARAQLVPEPISEQVANKAFSALGGDTNPILVAERQRFGTARTLTRHGFTRSAIERAATVAGTD